MRSRQGETIITDEQQEEVVSDMRKDAESLDKWARRLFVGMNATAAIAVLCCMLVLANAHPKMLGESSGYAHQAVLLTSVPGARTWLHAAYASTIVELVCAAQVCNGRGGRWTFRVAIIAGLGPFLIWVPRLARVRAPIFCWWLPLVAPLSLAVSRYVDSDMTDLAARVAQLDGLRYDCKGA